MRKLALEGSVVVAVTLSTFVRERIFDKKLFKAAGLFHS